jgi:hypothetical protein
MVTKAAPIKQVEGAMIMCSNEGDSIKSPLAFIDKASLQSVRLVYKHLSAIVVEDL